MVNIYFVYKKIKITIIGNHDNYPTLQDALFGAVKLTKNPDIDKCGYSGYRTGFIEDQGFHIQVVKMVKI